jgi:two-component system NtrC family sensor kinase
MAAVVRTIEVKCKRCYNCVRNCPANAIKVEGGQAKVIEDRCIGCGSCVKVCAQGAKEILCCIGTAEGLLKGRRPVFAALAPSFPAAFYPAKPGQVVSAVKALGFDEVLEVAFGAELVGRAYRQLARENRSELTITTPCPALVTYVEKYAPSLIPNLAPIVSPIIALGRAVKERYCPEAKIVFIGPCIAKKAEIVDENLAGVVEVALTYDELREMLRKADIDLLSLPETDFDGPRAHVARIFPVSGGLLRTAQLGGDILENEVLVTEGKDNVLQIIDSLRKEPMQVRFLDILFCEGCINGPVMGTDLSVFARKEIVTDYVNQERAEHSWEEREQVIDGYRDVDLSRRFTDRSSVLPLPSEEEIRAILAQINKTKPEDELNCGSCGYATCREKAIAVYQGLAEAEMCLPYLIDQLEENLATLEQYQRELHAAQDQLIQSEKLASMGQLAAGVAHEINNPLGTVLLYADVLLKETAPEDSTAGDLSMIVQQARRCKAIVTNLLNFARQNEVVVQPTRINELLDDLVGECARDPLFEGVEITKEFDPQLPAIQADSAQLSQLFLNLLHNAAEAMPSGGTVTLGTARSGNDLVEITVSDTGCGIPKENMKRLFTPFFTTKPIGQGTGLGLAISYGIVKMHRGNIAVESEVGQGTTFTISLPRELSTVAATSPAVSEA